ncbi:glycosyltransferase family 2 protein [Phreatobacter sp.]|uniref:glycosyltransferase family 2 protein n=1 Tax=Phreatobacter sp. TaxID=1966341 RepID=UPI003F72ECCA
MPHFRRTCLDQSLGWDPWNVTEDADLGFRLARNGWRTGTISLPTAEEAPARLAAWLGQRSRWFKGWLQTVAVLARAPRAVSAELGWRGGLALLATIAGTVGSALVHLVCLSALAVSTLLYGLPDWAGLAGLVAALGLGSSIAVKLLGLKRAGRLALAPWLALLPLVWAAMGVAALRALFELARRPFHWEKTEHGLCRPVGEATDPLMGDSDPAILAQASLAAAERVAAAGIHDGRDLAAVMAIQRQGLEEAGADPATLALVDAWITRRLDRPAPGA